MHCLSTGLPFVGQVYTILTPPLYFSTVGTTNPPGVGGTADDADIYFWNGSAFSRAIDVTAITNPLPTGANVDGFDRVDATHFYMSFNGTVTIVLPGPDLTVQDEDVVFYNAGTWSLYFDGSVNGRERQLISMPSALLAGPCTSRPMYTISRPVQVARATTPTSTDGTAAAHTRV